MTVTTRTFLDELRGRGLFYQATADDDAINTHLAETDAAPQGGTGRIGYAGFDPTADCLTIGHLIPINLLYHWQQAGHTPLPLMGGATGLIGDPSGKDEERQLRTIEEIEANVAGQQAIMEKLLDFDPARPNRASIVNNIDWIKNISWIEALRDIGKHFSVNTMMQKDSVRTRLEQREHGISYTEFSYQLLQAYDFLHLRRTMDCTVQMAGSDQYGNIVAGVDLIHRQLGGDAAAFGVTAPLVTRSDGKKIGKTEKGAVWLRADRTSPYAFYQYWINTDDADVERFLKWFSRLPLEHIDDVVQRHEQAPHDRNAQRELARHMTELLHGADAVQSVEQASEALFGGNITELDKDMLAEVFADVPHSTHDKSSLEGDGMSLVELLPGTSLASSKREARQFLGDGAVSVNGEKVEADGYLKTNDLMHGETILLRRGKKKWHATRWK